MKKLANYAALTGVAALLILLTGCASGPTANPRDPLEPLNRSVSKFNEGVDSAVLKPAATAYKNVTPAVVRTGVANFFSNVAEPWSFVNNLLQFKLQAAGESITRFSLNTVFGLFGLVDIASDAGIERHREDFGQTLGRWGVPAGPYLVLPILGSSTVRDAAALTVDAHGNLLHQVDNRTDRFGLYALRALEVRANLLRASNVLDEAALDKYSFTRDVYLQVRRSEIYDGNAPDPSVEPVKPAPAGQ